MCVTLVHLTDCTTLDICSYEILHFWEPEVPCKSEEGRGHPWMSCGCGIVIMSDEFSNQFDVIWYDGAAVFSPVMVSRLKSMFFCNCGDLSGTVFLGSQYFPMER
jgi:hypothetical protein